ncbi:MAG: FAD-dependent oxidoreductase [Bacteroidales bacterium]|nr:FAD-dependent oxidoreductase [Bacteroidales bacterium]
MYPITGHPILDIDKRETVTFSYEGHLITCEKGLAIAAALHQAGFPVHSYSLEGRNRSLECGIGKCGACEMIVDGEVRRICITPVDHVNEIRKIPLNYEPRQTVVSTGQAYDVYKTDVVIIGAGPAGLAARVIFDDYHIDNLVIDSNEKIGGQFLMQTHQFFFFEKEKTFGGMRGFDIAKKLAGEDLTGIFFNSTVWDILEGKRLAVKNIKTEEVYYVDAGHLVVATGAVPFMPPFENDDVPGVYTAAVVQKMMNLERTLLGKNVLTVGAGNIGYLTSYQLIQAGANVKAILEALPDEGGFPVQAARVRRLGIPIITSHQLLKAIPNKNHDGIVGAVVAESENFEPVPDTEKVIEDIDAINICTGLVSDDGLLSKGKEIFGRDCHGAGDAIRIGEGTSAVLRGKQVAYDILNEMGKKYHYNDYLKVSKEYIDSQQEPVRVLDEPYKPSKERREKKPFVIIDCLYGFACNPCAFVCPFGAITKSSTGTVPVIDYEKCTGCMQCVYQCPGLAIFGYNLKKDWVFLPIEMEAEEGREVYLVDNHGRKLGEGRVEKIQRKPNKTHIARVKSDNLHGDSLMEVRGFLAKTSYPEALHFESYEGDLEMEQYICHCDDVKLKNILEVIGERKFISVDEVKHTTRLGMGSCRGKRCVKRLKQILPKYGKSLVGEATPRGPMANQISMGELYPREVHENVQPFTNGRKVKKVSVQSLVAGGGIGGSALFRYLAEAGQEPVLVNCNRGSSWRNIAGGRSNFSLPELSDIADNNNRIFRELQEIANVDYRPNRYVTFAHNDEIYKILEKSMEWSDAYMIGPKDFQKELSPYFNPNLKTYKGALVARNCWQSTPGKVLDLVRHLGEKLGGTIEEDCRVIDVQKEGDTYKVLVRNHNREYVEYQTGVFVNALGHEGPAFAGRMGIETGLFPVKHQAFITRRLPYLGVNGDHLPMMIDRRNYKGFVAVYGQQLAETGQVIGCASPAVEPNETGKNLKVNSLDFMNIATEIFTNWIPRLSSVGFQAVWAGYYVEPRMVIDPELGLFLGLRGQGYMLGQYLAKLYVDKLMGKPIPDYFERLKLSGDGLLEKAFK